MAQSLTLIPFLGYDGYENSTGLILLNNEMSKDDLQIQNSDKLDFNNHNNNNKQTEKLNNNQNSSNPTNNKKNKSHKDNKRHGKNKNHAHHNKHQTHDAYHDHDLHHAGVGHATHHPSELMAEIDPITSKILETIRSLNLTEIEKGLILAATENSVRVSQMKLNKDFMLGGERVDKLSDHENENHDSKVKVAVNNDKKEIDIDLIDKNDRILSKYYNYSSNKEKQG